ncbi:hypothetical protein CLV51_106124 [Chitinophaga niastensis]|uniref:ADP-ribosyltransferase exoenzyme n=1 Tax=Chitinophaga niastensis TaxID=536980 RepID=A0A2P8HDH4_CHINA|nr:hypothetical protein [Chitinophaga niastensis]PSL44258.1 hypothetical protein CLV51_106124 [Chitinophaga niastensis]
MRKRIILLIIACCCHFTLSYARSVAVYNDYHEKIIQEGVAALNKLIRENQLHTLHGESYKNKYVLVLDGNEKYIEQRNVKVGNLVYNSILNASQEDSINQQLQAINTKKDFGIYVLVFNSWVIDLKKEIPEKAGLKEVMALQPYTNEDVKTKVWNEVDRLGEDILLRSELSSFAARIGIVYGREICYLGKGIHKAYATTNAYASGLGEGELNKINNSLKGKLPALSNTFAYLMNFPQELYKAYLKKDTRNHIKLQYKFKPSPGGYFDKLQNRLGTTKCDNCPPPNDASNLVFDYSSILTPEEKAKIFSKLGFISRESKRYKQKLYITDYQNPQPVLQAVQDYLANPDAKDIIVWVHFNENKEVEFNSAYGKDVPNQSEANAFVKFLANILPDIGLDFDPLTAMLDGLTTMVNALEIPERYYNPEHIDMTTGEADYNPLLYRVYQVSSVITLNPVLLNNFITIDGKYSPLQIEFAATCGFWNGLVHTASGLPAFVSWGIKMIVNENNTRADFVQAMQGMYAQCAQQHIEIAIPLPEFQMAGLGKCAWDKISHHFTTGNACVIAAKTGEAVFNVITLVIAFTKVGALAKISELMEMLDPINLMMKGAGAIIRTVVLPGGKIAYRCGKGAIEAVLKEGKYYLRIYNEALNVVAEIDWSKVLSWAEMVDQYGNKYRVGLLMSADEFKNAGYKIKKIVADASGKEFVDGSGRKFAVLGKEGDEASNVAAVVEDAAKNLDALAEYLLQQQPIQESLQILKESDLLSKVPDLKEYEAAAIHRYTRSSMAMNGKLYTGKALSEYEQKWLQAIKEGLADLRKTKLYEGRLFRGQSLPEELILDKYVTPFQKAKALGGPALVEEKALLSTSKSEGIADEFIGNSTNWKNNNVPTARPAKFVIESKRGVDIDDISDYGQYLGPKNHPERLVQQEVLLENGTFKINDVKIIDKGAYKEYIIFLEEF